MRMCQFRDANVWWRCAQYFVIASRGQVHRDNICVYMVYVCFYVCCSDYVGICGNVCCVAGVKIQNIFLTAQSTQIKSVISLPIKDFINHYPKALFNNIPRVGA